MSGTALTCVLASTLIVDEFQQIADRAMGFDGVAQRLAGFDAITVLATMFLAIDESVLHQVVDDVLHSPFGDPYNGGNVPQNHLTIGVKENQYMGVIGEKRPAGR